ncbi:uncharacterized protein LOC144153953 [Haemaphysalis longicornis]
MAGSEMLMFSFLVAILALAGAFSETVPMSYDDECGPVFSRYRRFGAKHLSQMTRSGRDAVMKCRNITESDAQRRDSEFEERRRQCIGLLFPSVPEERLETHLCRVTKMDDVEDVQRLRNLTACLKKGRDSFGKDERLVLELRASRMECLQEFFPDTSRTIQERKYTNLVKRVRGLADSVVDTHRQIASCMRVYSIPEEEMEERRRSKATCMKRIMPDVPEDRLERVFFEYLKNRSAKLDDALTYCTFLNTATGKWAKEELQIQYRCFQEVLPHMPSRARSSLSFRLGLDVQAEVIDKMLQCEAKGGTPYGFEGVQRPKYIRCVSGVQRHRPHSSELFDTSTIYDNPDPIQKLELCLLHKRSSSETFLEYRQHRKQQEKERATLAECYSRQLGDGTFGRPSTTENAGDAISEVGKEDTTMDPATTMVAVVSEAWSTVAPSTLRDPDTVKAE